jgi:hypothetical protein
MQTALAEMLHNGVQLGCMRMRVLRYEAAYEDAVRREQRDEITSPVTSNKYADRFGEMLHNGSQFGCVFWASKSAKSNIRRARAAYEAMPVTSG